MAGSLVYDIIPSMQREMFERIESRLRSIRLQCTSETEFRNRCSTFPKGGYVVYLFDRKPVFYTHFWIDQNVIHWTVMEGRPPFEVEKEMSKEFFGVFHVQA